VHLVEESAELPEVAVELKGISSPPVAADPTNFPEEKQIKMNEIFVTAVGDRPKLEFYFLRGQRSLSIYSRERINIRRLTQSRSGRESNTQQLHRRRTPTLPL